MFISNNTSGRLRVVMTEDEVRMIRLPLRAVLSADNKMLTIYHDPAGIQGTGLPGDRRVFAFEGDTARRIPLFGKLKVKPAFGQDKAVVMIPSKSDLPPTVSRNRLPALNAETTVSPLSPPSLRDLVRAINDRRREQPEDMVFSIDKDGYLSITVEYK